MTFLVNFSEQGGSFQAEFGETHNISDGGYERGYAKGYEEGRDIWNYVRSISGAFQNNTFPTGTNFVLNIPNLLIAANAGSFNYTFRSTTGLESITLKCTTRGVATNAHGAFSRCSDLKF